MPRIRTLKPEIVEDEDTASLSDSAFRLFVSLIVLADDYGNTRGEDWWIRSRVWGARRESPRIAEILRELTEADLVILYSVREQTYLHLCGWEKHQRVDNRGKQVIPPHDDQDSQIVTLDSATRGESPRTSASRGDPPLRPRTYDLGSGISEHRPATIDLVASPGGDSAPDVAESIGTAAAEDTSATKPPAKAKRAQRAEPMPEGWAPRSDELALAASLGVDATREQASFSDHHRAKGSRFVDWHAAFRTWLRNAVKFNRGGGGGGVRGGSASFFEVIDSLPPPREARS